MTEVPVWAWAAFAGVVLALLALDLGVFHREERAVSVREAATWTCVWVCLAILFNLFTWWWRGPEAALEFAAGYLIEESLSVDNLFVFVLIFASFRVPPGAQHRVLFWGILGALVLRFALIVAGAWLIARFSWVTYVFGTFLVVTGLRLVRESEAQPTVHENFVVRLARRLLPLTADYRGSRFLVREEGRLVGTPLFIVLVLVETTDVIFALDSIPAIFAVTLDPFIVFTSNVFAILGLRSLYFVLAGVISKFHYLKTALAGILAFVGFKMLVARHLHVPVAISLGVIASMLLVAVMASIRRERRLRSE